MFNTFEIFILFVYKTEQQQHKLLSKHLQQLVWLVIVTMVATWQLQLLYQQGQFIFFPPTPHFVNSNSENQCWRGQKKQYQQIPLLSQMEYQTKINTDS